MLKPKVENIDTKKSMILDESCDSVHFGKHIFDIAARYCSGSGLDLGCGDCKYPGSIGIDLGGMYGVSGVDDVNDFRNLSSYSGMDYVFSSHALEHCAEWKDVIRESFACLRSGGCLFLYLPWDEHNPSWKPENLGLHAVSMKPSLIREVMMACGFEDIGGMTDEDGPDSVLSFWMVGRKP